MQTFFIVDLCTFSLLQQHERHPIFFGTVVKPKQGGVVRTLSLPSTVHGHNFRRQISVHKFPSTDNFRQHSYTHDTHSCSRCAHMNELKMGLLRVKKKPMRLVYRVSCDGLGSSSACAWNSEMAQSSLSQIRVIVQYHENVKLSTKDKEEYTGHEKL